MKILNYILSFFKWLKELFDTTKWILIIVCFLFGAGWINSCKIKNKKVSDIRDILTSEIKQVETDRGNLATEAKTWRLKYSELNKMYGKELLHNSLEINQYKKELSEANEIISELEIKRKNVENYIKNELISKDSIRTELVFFENEKIEIKPIRKKHIEIDFIQDGRYLDVKYKYSASVNTIISRYPELKDNGKKHFPNWGFIWGWGYKTTSIIDDPNASIENLVSIEFDK